MIPENSVFLSSTDTTVGFLSRDRTALDRIKGRPSTQPYITVLPSLSSLRQRVRTPRRYRKMLRRSVRKTYIFPNGRSYRIVGDARHLLLLERLGWAYSTSANPAGAPYDETFARQHADIVVEPLLAGAAPSSIYKIGKKRIKKIR